MAYNFNKHLKVGKFSIDIDTVALHGCVEHDIHGEGGELKFAPREGATDGQLELIDYDGYSVLPKTVVESLRSMGFYLDEVYDNEDSGPKLFNCYWGKGYNENGEIQLVKSDFINEGRGYSYDDIAAVQILQAGESYLNGDHGLNSHIITRVQ